MEYLASSAISLVSPYLVKGAEEFAKEAGKEAFEAVTGLYDRLAKWWSSDPVASAAANAMKDAPERNGKLLGAMLMSALNEDSSLAGDIQRLTDSVGPHVRVIQNIEVAEGVTGARIGELISGSVDVTQQMKHAKDTTGVIVDRMGR
jgi:hypothetical protein